jgi:PAS domain-containing protein
MHKRGRFGTEIAPRCVFRTVQKIEGLLKGNVISGLPFSHRKQPDSISLIDSDGEILYESASTTRLFGYQPEDRLAGC